MSTAAPARTLSILLVFLLWLTPVLAVAAEISIAVKGAPPGADFSATLSGLAIGSSYRIDLVRGGISPSRTALASFTAADDIGRWKLTVPDNAVVGSHTLELMLRGKVDSLADSVAFTVQSPLSVLLEPASAEPGRAVRVTVSGLRAGSLAIDYAGGTVVGPVAVGDGTWVGKFVVPRDRPTSIPSTVKVVARNTIGRLTAVTGTTAFQVLAPSGLPAFRSSFITPPPTVVADSSRLAFSGKLVRPDDKGTSGRTSFFWRSDDGRITIPIDGVVDTDADGNYVPRNARGPSLFMDGIDAGGSSGTVYGVVSDNDPDVDTRRDVVVNTGHSFIGGAASEPPEQTRFLLRLRGRKADGTTEAISNAYVEVLGAAANAFSDPRDGNPLPGDDDLYFVQSQLSRTITQAGSTLRALPQFGCPVSFSQGYTDPQGEIPFEFDPNAARNLQIMQKVKDMGEIRTQFVGAPIPGVDVFKPGDIFQQPGGKAATLEEGQDAYIDLRIYAGHRGYGENGIGTQPPLVGIPLFRATDVSLVVMGGSGELVVNQAGGVGVSGTLVNGVLTVTLPALPSGTEAATPFHLAIEGLRAPVREGVVDVFKGMHSFPNTSTFPNSVFTELNVGRKMRFYWEAGFGFVQSAKVFISTPAGLKSADFVLQGSPVCNLGSAGLDFEFDEYLAELPDLTRLPAKPAEQTAECFNGVVALELLGGKTANRQIKLCTQLPPPRVTSEQVANLKINARTTEYSGDLVLPDTNVTESDPRMQEWDIPPLENSSGNEGDFSLGYTPTGFERDVIGASTEHVLGNEGTDPTDYLNNVFGFDGARSRANIIRETVLDTGVIPLFRYPWGFSPIAGAIFGADFWLSASLAFYGDFGGGGKLMNATIDPTLNGGVDVFFDLDILFGVVSASVSANPQMGLSLKEIVGNGGLSGDTAGACFGFDVDVSMEICAVFCAEDRFNLFRAREPNGCSVSMKSGVDLSAGFDLPRPTLAPSALEVDGHGNTVVVELDGANRLVAHHMAGTTLLQTRVIVPVANGIQHADVAYLGNNVALAVWSENTLDRITLGNLLSGKTAVRTNTAQIARAQVLRYATFDGTAWSAPQNVPGASGGSGKPKLATGRCLFCLRGSSLAYLVWEYDANQNIDAPDIEVWGAEFSSSAGFRGATRISGSTATSDMHPDVVYLGSTPVVAWVSGALPHYTSTASRKILYRFVNDPDGGKLTTAVRDLGVPTGAGWPTLSTANASTLLVAYTVAAPTAKGVRSAVGNRNALNVARGSCSGDSCTFQRTELRDPAGRQYRGERPSIAVGADGAATISFRGLAYGPDASGQVGRPSDTIGMLTGSGEHLVLRVSDFSKAVSTVAPQALSNDGLQHWRPNLAFDPATEAFIGISRRASLPAGKHAALEAARAYATDAPAAIAVAKSVGTAGLVMTTLAPMTDFRIEALALNQPYLSAGQTVTFALTLRNAGVDYDPAVDGSATVLAAWDAPPGVGTQAMAPVALAALPANGLRQLAPTVTVPAGHHADERRTLFVEIRPASGSEDANGTDNHADVTVGAMPVPQGMTAMVKTNSPVVALDWFDDTDPRVVGYRVYKLAESGEFVPYGSSPVSGYADLFAGYRNVEQYRITSYSARGIESEPGAIVLAEPKQSTRVFVGNFEPQL